MDGARERRPHHHRNCVTVEPEVVPGYPNRILPRDEAAAKVLKTRTLTNLYNQRPAWLDMAHLFALNQDRAAAGR